jgi:hypothetical protein
LSGRQPARLDKTPGAGSHTSASAFPPSTGPVRLVGQQRAGQCRGVPANTSSPRTLQKSPRTRSGSAPQGHPQACRCGLRSHRTDRPPRRSEGFRSLPCRGAAARAECPVAGACRGWRTDRHSWGPCPVWEAGRGGSPSRFCGPTIACSTARFFGGRDELFSTIGVSPAKDATRGPGGLVASVGPSGDGGATHAE